MAGYTLDDFEDLPEDAKTYSLEDFEDYEDPEVGTPQESEIRQKWEQARSQLPVDGPKGEEVAQLPIPTPNMFDGMSPEDQGVVFRAYTNHPNTKKSWTGETLYNDVPIPEPKGYLNKLEGGYDTPVEGLVDLAGGAWNAGKSVLTTGASMASKGSKILKGTGVPGAEYLGPLGGLGAVIPEGTSQAIDEAIPEYRSDKGPVGDLLVSAGEWIPGGFAGGKLATKVLQGAKPLTKFGGGFIGSEAGGAMTLDKDTINTLVGMNIPGLRGLAVNPKGDFDENLLRQKLNQVQDAVIVGAALGGAVKASGKVGGYFWNVGKKMMDWQSLDAYQREFVSDIIGMAGGINDTMTSAQKNEIMSDISEYVAKNKETYISFGDGDIEDVKHAQDTISVIIKKLEADPEKNAPMIQMLKEARSSALEGGSPSLETTLKAPRGKLEGSLEQGQVAKGGDAAIEQTKEMIQKDADEFVQGYRDETYRAEDKLSKADKDTNEILRQDPAIGAKIQEAETKGVPFDAEASRIESADGIASEAQRAREEVLRPQSDAEYAKIPADAKVIDGDIGTQYERVKGTLSKELQDKFEASEGDYKTLVTDFNQDLRRYANSMPDGKDKQDLLGFAKYVEGAGPEDAVAATKNAKEFYRNNEGRFNQGASEELKDANKNLSKLKPAEYATKTRKIISSAVKDPDRREEVALLREQLSLVKSDPRLDDHIMGEAAADLNKIIDEKGISSVNPKDLRNAFNTMAGNLSENAKGRMEKVLQEFEKGKKNVSQLKSNLDALTKEADRVEVEVYGDKLREFFEVDPTRPGKRRPVGDGYKAFEKMFSDPDNAGRINELVKKVDTDPVMKKGTEVAVIKMIEKHLAKNQKMEFPEGFEKLALKVMPKDAVDGWKYLANETKRAELANVTRKGQGFNQSQFQEGMVRSTNQLITWVFGVLNPTAARIRTVTGDLLKEYNPKVQVKTASDDLLANPEKFAEIARKIVLENKGKMSPEDRALIFRGIVNATKDHPEDGQKDKSGITKAIDQTEKMLNPFD